MKTLNLIPVPHQKILVALSGGADSVALLRSLHAQSYDIEALHCNFQLRGEESDRDERFVVSLCQKYDIPLHVKRFETKEYAKEHGISIEMAARELRYEWFEQKRIELHAAYIAVAHHSEDQAETVLLNLIRGTGLRGLAGMKFINGHIIRPMLNVSKSEILEYLKRIDQDYVTDSSNFELDATRNRIRLEIMPKLKQINPHVTEHFAEAARYVAEAIPYYEKGIEASNAFSSTMLHEQLTGCGFTAAQEKAIMRDINGESGAIYESATHKILRDRGKLILKKKESTTPPPQLQTEIICVDDALAFLRTQPLSADYAYLDADKVPLPLTLRHPRTGDRFQPFGMKRGTRLISDFLTDLKLSVFEKEEQWLVCMGEQIVWVKGLRIDQRFCITSDTRRVLVLH